MRHQRELDFTGLDAKAIDLDLLVGAAEVEQAAVGLALREVAGAVPAAGQAGEVVEEAFGAQLGTAEIAVRQRVAADQQLAGVGRRAGTVGFDVPERDLHVRQRRADRRDVRPAGGVAAQVAGGDHMAFGGPVVVVQLGSGQAREQRADRRRDAATARRR